VQVWFLVLGTLEIIGSGGAKPTVGKDELDLLQLHDVATAGHQAMNDGDHCRATDYPGRALSRWLGPLEHLPAFGPEVSAREVVLEEARQTFIEELGFETGTGLQRTHTATLSSGRRAIDGPPGGELFERQFARDPTG
jgi:hypothetical protein